MPQAYIAIEKILGINTLFPDKTIDPAVKTLNFIYRKFLDEYLDTPINPEQVVSKNNITEIINKIYSAAYTEIHLHGNLDFLIPWIHPKRHCSVNIYSSPNVLKHKLTTRIIDGNYFFRN